MSCAGAISGDGGASGEVEAYGAGSNYGIHLSQSPEEPLSI